MQINHTYLAFLGGLLLFGCQPASTLTPIEGPALPAELSASYERAFAENPEITAHRFLSAYDNFAATGAVSRARVRDYTRLQDGLERGRLLGYVLALDLDGDGQITRAEFDTFSVFPKGPNKILALSDLFGADDNQDEIISLTEAVLYSRKLHARAATQDMRPIESYLMLFDINGDGQVARAEMKRHLFDLFPIREADSVRGKAGLRRASPK